MINGEEREAPCQTLTQLVESLGHSSTAVATAINGVFVPIAERDKQVLQERDAVEIIAPMAGG